MNQLTRTFTAWSALAALACGFGLPLVAHADSKHGRGLPLLPAYQQECSSCHVAYPPGMLPAASWQVLMNNLPRHFGADASVDAATQKDLSTWLTANGSKRFLGGSRPPEDRITRSDWFVREHREVPSRTWSVQAVRGPSNCAACHTTAEQGEFNERNVRLPR